MVFRRMVVAAVVSCLVVGGAMALPDTGRIVLTLSDAHWEFADPEPRAETTLYLERRDGAWLPTLSADAQRSLNVAHDAYIVDSRTDGDEAALLVRLHVRRDRWMDRVSEAAYRIRFTSDGQTCTGTWQGVVHGTVADGAVTGIVKKTHVVPNFVPPAPGERPRLLIRRSHIETLREKAATDWGVRQLAEIREDRSAAAQGFAYALTGDAVHVKRVKAALEKAIARNEWFCSGGNQHDPAFRVVDQLLGFDMVYDACDEAFRKRVINHVADKLEMFYWGAYNTQFNGHDRSNWSLMFRSAAGIMALTVLDAPLEAPERRAAAALLHVLPIEPAAIPDGVPVVEQHSEKPIDAWLYAGPLGEPFNADGFAAQGGMPAARPRPGDKLGSATFRLLSSQEVKEGRDPGSLEIRKGAIDLRKVTGRRYLVANYLYCVLHVSEAGFFRFESNKNPKGVRQQVAYLNGERIRPKEYVRLDVGHYPLLVRVWNEPVGGWEPHVFWCRFVKVSKEDAMAWHGPRAAGVAADAECGSDWRAAVGAKTPWNLVALRRLRQAQHEAEGYFTKGLGDYGWNQEGEAYTRHAIRLGIPFALCFRNVFGLDMDGADRLGKMMALCTARTVFSDEGAMMQSFNVGGGAMDADLFSRAFFFVPDALRPAVLDTWKRSMALADAGKLNDPHGIVATHDGLSKVMRFVNYPLTPALSRGERAGQVIQGELAGKERQLHPGNIMPKVTVDEQKGGYVFRNRWQDGEDCVVQLWANSNAPGGTWSAAQSGTFRILGLGHYWAVRGQGYGNGASGRSLPDYSLYQNMVDVDGHYIAHSPQAWTTHFQSAADGSGVVSLNMDEVYLHVPKTRNRKGRWRSGDPTDIGIRATRSVAVDYSGAAGVPCLVAVADRLAGTPGSNTWQMAVPIEHTITVADNTFVIEADDGATLHGTVVRPVGAAPAVVEYRHVHEINYHGGHSQGKFRRRAILVPARGKDVEFLVVMTLQHGSAPRCAYEDATTRIGKQTVAFDGERIRLGMMEGKENDR